MTIDVRLVGGPFDGDRGPMDSPLPGELWAYPCRAPDQCDVGGIHWTDHECDDGERYVYGPLRGGLRLYLWAELNTDPNAPTPIEEAEPVAA